MTLPRAASGSVLAPAWRPVLQANDLPARRYVLAVLPSNELNAFACGGHLVVVTSYAIEALPRDELSGVLAHELSHHLGLHTVALTVGQWLSIPVLLLARIGFFLQNVASAATTSYASQDRPVSPRAWNARETFTPSAPAPTTTALRRFVADFGGDRPLTWRDRLAASHPTARTRVARIEAMLRSRR